MSESLEFTPYEIHRDWQRFSTSWITVEHSDGTWLEDGGLLEMTALYDEHGHEERVSEGAEWSEMCIEYNYLQGVSIRMSSYQMEAGDKLHFCPDWHHNGYANVPTQHAAQDPSRPPLHCVWVSLSAARQYRYGLTSRAFEARATTLSNLGRTTAVGSRDLFHLHKHGPMFAPVPTGEVSGRGLALSANLALHHVSQGITALCHNARRIIGWHIAEEGLLVEETARPITRHLENVSYAPTDELVALWQTTILPRRFTVESRSTTSPPAESEEPVERARPGRLDLYPTTPLPTADPGPSLQWLSDDGPPVNRNDWESWVSTTATSLDDLPGVPGSSSYAAIRNRDRERGDT